MPEVAMNMYNMLDYSEKKIVLDLIYSLAVRANPSVKSQIKSENAKKMEKVYSKISEQEQLEFCDAGLESLRELTKNDSW